jgi:hypothetical protein
VRIELQRLKPTGLDSKHRHSARIAVIVVLLSDLVELFAHNDFSFVTM